MKSSLDFIAAVQSIGTSFALGDITAESAYFILSSIMDACEKEMTIVRKDIIDTGGTTRLKVTPVKRWTYDAEPSLAQMKKQYDHARKHVEQLMVTAAELGMDSIVDIETGQCVCAANCTLTHRINVK